MPCEVVTDETGDEVIAVVVAGLHPQRQRMPGFVARPAQALGLQLDGQELVGLALVDQQRQAFARVADQFARIPRTPRIAVGAI